jgi:hypothetical protein
VKGVIQGALARAFQWLVHGVFLEVFSGVFPVALTRFFLVSFPFPWPESWAFALALARALSQGRFSTKKPDSADFCRHKILKSRLAALSKAGQRWYIPPRAPHGIRQG